MAWVMNMLARPAYYDDFTCIASRCRHNCCIGWEIDIDEETMRRYDSMTGEMRRRLNECISREDAPHFILGADERCPFLNEENLCDLILTGGEEALCQICRDHPRFRSFLPGREEIGLGMACEEAARLILSQTEPMTWRTEGAVQELDPDAQEVLEAREWAFQVIWDRALPMDERLRELLHEFGAERMPLTEAVARLMKLEVLDEAWRAALTSLSGQEIEPGAGYEPLAEYIFLRHFPGVYEGVDPAGVAGLCDLAVRLVAALDRERGHDFADRVEHARMFSSEIEYSQDNLDELLSSF